MVTLARVAAIDCGTNSIRLLVADIPDVMDIPDWGERDVSDNKDNSHAGLSTDIIRHMEIVRLGQGVDRTGRLAPEAIERTRVALAAYVAQIRELRVDRVRMVATSATRDAANAADFHDMVLATLGAAPDVLTGDEEARLSFDGAVRDLPRSMPPPYLVVDVGGGSTELVLGDRGSGAGPASAGTSVGGGTGKGNGGSTGGSHSQVHKAISVDIGCVRMTERYLLDDPPTPEQIAAAGAHIDAVLAGALREVDGHLAHTLVGLAGSVTTVTAIALGLDTYRPERVHQARVSRAEVEAVTARLLGMTRAQRLDLPVMHPGRADVIGAGALILRILMQRVHADAVIASEHDILDGIAYSLSAH